MTIKPPEAVKPLLKLLVHIGVGALALAGLLVIEVLLSGFVKLLGMATFAPRWFPQATDLLERGFFIVDLFVVGLFLSAEIIKFGRELWNEIRHE